MHFCLQIYQIYQVNFYLSLYKLFYFYTDQITTTKVSSAYPSHSAANCACKFENGVLLTFTNTPTYSLVSRITKMVTWATPYKCLHLLASCTAQEKIVRWLNPLVLPSSSLEKKGGVQFFLNVGTSQLLDLLAHGDILLAPGKQALPIAFLKPGVGPNIKVIVKLCFH